MSEGILKLKTAITMDQSVICEGGDDSSHTQAVKQHNSQ